MDTASSSLDLGPRFLRTLLLTLPFLLPDAVRGAEISYHADPLRPDPIVQGWNGSETATPGADLAPRDGRLDPPANVGPVTIDTTAPAIVALPPKQGRQRPKTRTRITATTPADATQGIASHGLEYGINF